MMSAQSDLLNRLRQGFAAPGAPAAAGGVPGDLRSDLEAEIRPLLARLDAIEDEADELRRGAQAEAAAVAAAAKNEAERIVAVARAAVPATRAATAESRRSADEQTLGQLLEEAAKKAEDVRQAGAERMPELVCSLVACVRGTAMAGRKGHAA